MSTEMNGRWEWVENHDPETRKTDGIWKIRVVLYLFGKENEIFLSNEWYMRKEDAWSNFDLIFCQTWEFTQ